MVFNCISEVEIKRSCRGGKVPSCNGWLWKNPHLSFCIYLPIKGPKVLQKLGKLNTIRSKAPPARMSVIHLVNHSYFSFFSFLVWCFRNTNDDCLWELTAFFFFFVYPHVCSPQHPPWVVGVVPGLCSQLWLQAGWAGFWSSSLFLPEPAGARPNTAGVSALHCLIFTLPLLQGN